MHDHRSLSPVLVAAFDTVMAARAIYSVYQPVVTLDTFDVVGYEALARGPAGTSWSSPDMLVEYAAQAGRLPELDWICRAAACRGALATGLPPAMPLFVNVEPASSRSPCPPDLIDTIGSAVDRLQIVAEVTERAVAHDPAGLLAAVENLRKYTNRIALDDVGADAASQAMMSLMRPDVIKLDRTIVQSHRTPAVAAVIAAARAEAARTGAVILAEGIETPEHLALARSAGATLGQGFLLGHPAALPRDVRPPVRELPRLTSPALTAATPFEVASASLAARPATRKTLVPLCRALEDKGIQAVEPIVLLATLQQAKYFDESARNRYADLAEHGILTAIYAEDIPDDLGSHIRGRPLHPGDPLAGEWNVIVIGSQFAGGVFARAHPPDGGGGGAGGEYRSDQGFDLIASDDRDLILAAARPLLQRLAPIASSPF